MTLNTVPPKKKYAYAANYLIQAHKSYKHKLMPRKKRYKHMRMPETTFIKYISGTSIFPLVGVNKRYVIKEKLSQVAE